MRCLAGFGLLALVGCNQIFGIAPTRGFDAAIDSVADSPHVVLDRQLATASSGAPNPVAFMPLDPPPRVRITTLDTPFAANPNDDPDKTSYSAGGEIQIPHAYVTTPWRLEYQLQAPGEPPHEVQWMPDDKQGHLTVPSFGRLDRGTPPESSGFTIVASSSVTPTLGSPRVITTGLWTEGIVTTHTGNIANYSFSSAISLDGPPGNLDASQGDQVLLVDYTTQSNGCRVAVGSGLIAMPVLTANALTNETVSWNAALSPVTVTPVPSASLIRMFGILTSAAGWTLSNPQSVVLFGSVASDAMPPLTVTPDHSPLGLSLPMPVIQTLSACPNSAALSTVNQPAALLGFPLIVHAQLVETRQALGVTLAAGMETVLTAMATANGPTFPMAFPAPLATQIALTTPTTSVDLSSGTADQLPIGSATGSFTLSFVPEAAVGPADYYDVILHGFSGGALTVERIYTVTAPSVRIDGSVLASGADYVFEIRSYKGHPKAAHGDFSAISFPYGSAIVFSHTFKPS